MKKEDITIIEIEWEGPFSLIEVKQKIGPSDYGIYQIYGTHTIFGSNSLLYIGKANDQTFAQRIDKHKEWISWEPEEVRIYLGRLGGVIPANDQKWKELINDAEKLLIYYCAPPYNSSNIVKYGNVKNTIVMNFGKKSLIPYEISTLYDVSEYWGEGHKWKLFGI